MKQKPINPYTTLKNKFNKYITKCICRKTVQMWKYPKDKLDEVWDLQQLWERTSAAEQLGFDVQLKATDTGLHVEYVAKLPDRPWDV